MTVSCKPVRLLIEHIGPACEWIAGGWQMTVDNHPGHDERFGSQFAHGNALGGEFGKGAKWP